MEPAKTDGAEILIEAHGLITGPRQAEYDHPFDDYGRVAKLFHIITGVDLTIEEAVTFMVCVKLARLSHTMQNQRPQGWKHDTLVDAIGYLGCLNMVRESRRRQ